jgi:hypothetical protein
MGRPIYENTKTQKDEQGAIQQFLEYHTEKHGWPSALGARKLPMSYRLDYALVANTQQVAQNHRIVSWAEVKRRKCNHNSFATLILSWGKWLAACEAVTMSALPFHLVVQWEDRWGYLGIFPDAGNDTIMPVGLHIPFPDVASRVYWGGRTSQTRDAGDIEPVIHIPIKSFFIV